MQRLDVDCTIVMLNQWLTSNGISTVNGGPLLSSRNLELLAIRADKTMAFRPKDIENIRDEFGILENAMFEDMILKEDTIWVLGYYYRDPVIFYGIMTIDEYINDSEEELLRLI